MQVQFRIRVISLSGGNHFFARQNPLHNLPQTLEMVTEPGHLKRPMCPSCSKPTRLCLCTRLKTPCLQNSVAVSILQHSLEKKHPLNSTRIASIGLQNLSVISVSDVNYEAQFFIHLLNSSNLEMGSKNFDEKTSSLCDTINIKDSNFDNDAAISFNSNDNVTRKIPQVGSGEGGVYGDLTPTGAGREAVSRKIPAQEAAISFIVEKYGAISSFQDRDFSKLFGSRAAIDDIRKGFLVKKLQRKPLNGSSEYQEMEEFEVAVPKGSVLLFPSENSIGMEDIDFEVKNLIVLDGTWPKAKRMYNENPWLKMLPHVRLDVEKLSLYSEVRHQPKAGFLSTIESIVYALKAVGEENSEGLDHLLDVFESMVGDQRRCKDENLKRKLSNCD